MDLLDKKLDYWEHQLLDLGKRNKMINYRETQRSTLKLVEPGFNEFYERIAINEEELTFQRPIDKDTDIRVYSILSLLEQLSAPIPVSIGDIKADGSILERQRTLKIMRSKSRLASEEQGTNILYLSFGFLEWYCGKGANAHLIRSPLVLVPVVLSLESLNSPYILSKHEDDIVLNPTLVYYLKTEFGVELPTFDADKDDINDYLHELEAVADQRGWRIVREVSLGLLSFLKITMYNDLLVNRERIRENPVIKALSGNNEDINNIPEQLQSFDLDSVKPHDCFQIMSADSSQQEAILYSKNGVSFVMQGPPGTGKSQTIANIIAEALGDGKTVLFVSEKMAALQVVYKRLRECHIADFCLPLHSYKANKKEILDQIGSNLKIKQTVVKDTAISSLEELSILRKALNDYASELHSEIPGMKISCYEAYTKVIELRNVTSFPFTLSNITGISQGQIQSYLSALNEYSLSVNRLNNRIKNNPWEGLKTKSSEYEYTQKMSCALTNACDSLSIICHSLSTFMGNDDYLKTISLKTIIPFCNTLEQLERLPAIPVNWVDAADLSKQSEFAEEGKNVFADYKKYRNEIESVFNSDIYEFDCVEWRENLLEIVNKTKSTKLTVNHYAEYFIDKRDELLQDFTRLNHCFVNLNTSYSTICNALNVDNKYNTESIEKIEHFLELLAIVGVIPRVWLDNDSKSITDTIEEAEFLAAQIKKNKQKILTNWNETLAKRSIINKYFDVVIEKSDLIENIIRKHKEIKSDTDQILSIAFFSSISEDDAIHERQSYNTDLMFICNVIESLKNDFAKINELFGSEFVISKENCEKISDIVSILESGYTFPTAWLGEDFSRICSLYVEAKEKYDNATRLKNEILSDWEKEIFDLDYKPMMTRYKTDYTNVFKYFSKQYKIDRKTIQALYRKPIKSPKDDFVYGILDKLKQYSELLEWFDDKENELTSSFGSYFKGFDTDWERINRGITLKRNLEALIDNKSIIKYYSEKEGAGKQSEDDLKTISDRCSKGFTDINSILTKWNASVIITQIADEQTEIISDAISSFVKLENDVCEYISLISCITDCFESVDSSAIFDYIISEKNEAEVNSHFDSLGLFIKNSQQLEDKKEHFTSVIGNNYSGVATEWETIRNQYNTYRMISDIFNGSIPPLIQNILYTGNSDAISDLGEAIHIIKVSLDDIAKCIDGKRYNIKIEEDIFEPQKYVHSTEKLVEQLSKIKDHFALIIPYLCESNISFVNITNAVDSFELYLKLKTKLKSKASNFKKTFGYLYCDDKTDWDKLINLINAFSEIKQQPYYNCIVPIVKLGKKDDIGVSETTSSVKDSFNNAKDDLEWICQQFSDDYPFDDVTISILDGISLKDLSEKLVACLENISEMGNWIDYQEARDKCNSIGLSDFITKLETRKYSDSVNEIFLKGFYNMWIEAVMEQLSSVRRFRKNKHEEMIKQFIDLDDAQLIIAQMRIREKIIEGLPSENRMLRANDEVAILSREFGKKRKIMPLRKLFRQIPNLLMKLKPCLMMSPLSVSYFLESEAYHFDMVIFDEASQIFPEDAIGAIYRGSQVIIAGDSKQLPPTNFFSAATNNSDGEYDNDEENDYEDIVSGSILEEAASALPNRTLLWHYRSKHESLIAFSNREIYQNNLITFPNNITKAPNMGVEYIYVENGFYEGGGKNRNVREAQKCVMLVLDHIQHNSSRSLGIIAFSEKQQNAIETAIMQFRQKMPQYEWFFDESKEEPFFVKNLENVQGDERDTIIFSICYAKDKTGRMYMRFGPLGHDGGERRLNVAITRAKCNVKLVGSILPTDIDLSKTNSEGVRMLRSYIEFAMRGTSALNPVKDKSPFESVDTFCDIIESFLVDKGYNIVRNVGASDYKIDIAVKHPKKDEVFVVGIECDGYSYKKAKTARDRDHLRGTILKNMGWSIYRVWSTEWYRNEKEEQESLLTFINAAIASFDQSGSTVSKNASNSEIKYNEISRETDRNSTETDEENPYGFDYYTEADLSQAIHSGNHDNLTLIADYIIHVVSVEEPIHMEVLYKRLGPAFKTGKATEGVKSTIRLAIKERMSGKVVIDKGNYIRTLPLKKIVVRIPEPNGTPRPMEYIHTEEVAEAMKAIITNSFGITEENLSSECAKAFGFERKGAKIKAKTDDAIEFLVSKGFIKVIDGKVQLIGE